jgi:hypothetical protein
VFHKSQIVEGAATMVPTRAFRGCTQYVRQGKPGDDGFYLLRVSGPATDLVKPDVSIHLFVGDELEIALALDRLRIGKPARPDRASP